MPLLPGSIRCPTGGSQDRSSDHEGNDIRRHWYALTSSTSKFANPLIEDLLQHMGRLRKELVVESNLKEFDSKYDTILCHFEPFRQGHTPFQLSDSNRPIAICKYANKPGSLSSNMTYSLDKSSMHAFMSRFAMGSIPPSLRDINVSSSK